MAFIIALLLVLAFVVNVMLGAVSNAPLVSNVVEMLILLGASIAFVVGILRSEAKEKKAFKIDE